MVWGVCVWLSWEDTESSHESATKAALLAHVTEKDFRDEEAEFMLHFVTVHHFDSNET